MKKSQFSFNIKQKNGQSKSINHYVTVLYRVNKANKRKTE